MLGFYTNLTHLADRDAFAAHVQAMRRIDWVVYAKKPFGGPAQVLAHLGRYTHRVAIANSRIKALDDDHVAFNWKDYRQNGAEKIMRLKPDEFIRRRAIRESGGFCEVLETHDRRVPLSGDLIEAGLNECAAAAEFQ